MSLILKIQVLCSIFHLRGHGHGAHLKIGIALLHWRGSAGVHQNIIIL